MNLLNIIKCLGEKLDYFLARRIGLYLMLSVTALLFFLPILWMVSGSLKPEINLYKSLGSFKAFLPIPFTLENYSKMFERAPFFRYLMNSLLMVGSTVTGGLLVNSMAGYALARLEFPFRRFFSSLSLALIIIPIQVIFIPLFVIVNKFGWINSYLALIVPFIANPLGIFLFREFFAELPRSLEEAAYLDGASYWQVYWRIILPLSKPVLATVAIITGLMQWSSFLWPLVATTNAKYRPLSVGLQSFFSMPPIHWGQILAFSTLSVVPILLLFIFFQRYFIQGIAAQGRTE